MSSNIRTRQPRLRASCDGCFLAKVKCSKGQPACQRCLTCGLVCHYSPSSRAGKPKAISPFTGRQANTVNRAQPLHLLVDENSMSYAHLQQPQPILQQNPQSYLQPEAALQQNLAQPPSYLQQPESNLQQPSPFLQHAQLNNIQTNNIYPMEGPWPTPPGSLESTVAGNPSLLADPALFSMDDGQMARESNPMSATSEPYSSMTAWTPTPPTDMANPAYPSNGSVAPHMQTSNVRSHSLDAAMPMAIAWPGVPSPHGLPPYSKAQSPQSMPNTYFPSDPSPPLEAPPPTVFDADAAQSADHSVSSCPLFNVCLESLQSQDFSLTPGKYHFDVVVFLNHTPAEECLYHSADHDAIRHDPPTPGDVTLVWRGHLPYLATMPN